MVKKEKIIKETVEELLKLLTIDGTADVSMEEDSVQVVLETQDSGIVIGYHGEVLEALQLVLSLCISKKIGEFIRVSVEVGDYKKNRSSWLETIALQSKEQALAENREVPLPNLKSWERRIVHVYLQDDKEVLSESVGEGRDRTLVVKPRV